MQLLVLFVTGLLAAGPTMAASPSAHPVSPTSTLDSDFRAAYPSDAPSSITRLSGVALDRLVLPGLQLSGRSEQAGDDGGLVLSYADRAGTVRVLLQVAVLPDVALSRRVLDEQLHGVAAPLSRALDPLLGDLAWADDGGRGGSLVLATQANIAYSVHVVEAGADVPTAAAVAGQLRLAMVPGAPACPTVTLALPPVIDAQAGGELRVYVPGGQPYKLRADGAYIARGQSGPVVRPFAKGPLTVYATAVSDLACVTTVSATSLAQ